VSDDGADVVGVFKRLFSQAKVRILLGHQVVSLQKKGEVFVLALKDKPALEVDRVVLTTGGQAYRQTGSTGDGYAFAEQLGHTITPLAPSLSAFIVAESWPKTLAGVSVKKATLHCGDKAFTGPFLFTHKGITGPAVFALSALIAFESCTPQQTLKMTINLFPDRRPDEFVKEIHSQAQLHGKKSLINVMATLLPRSIAEVCLNENHINADQHAADLSKEQAQNMVFFSCPFDIVKPGLVPVDAAIGMNQPTLKFTIRFPLRYGNPDLLKSFPVFRKYERSQWAI
jgi:predicted Rossmann fold flavoprotein